MTGRQIDSDDPAQSRSVSLVKDPDAHKLAQAVAQETGETMVNAVTGALRERLARVRRADWAQASVQELLAIGKRCAASLKGTPVELGKLLYNERGLPR